MPTITVEARPNGLEDKFETFNEQREITDDLPADIIGKAVVVATQRAWRAGFDPTVSPFIVLVKFS